MSPYVVSGLPTFFDGVSTTSEEAFSPDNFGRSFFSRSHLSQHLCCGLKNTYFLVVCLTCRVENKPNFRVLLVIEN